MVNYTLVGAGVVVNLVLLVAYYFLHRQIEKFKSVKEKIILSVKRARTSYFLFYLVAVGVIVLSFFVPADFRIMLVFLTIAIVILLEILHDGKRLVLTEYELITIKGFLNTKVTMVEYKDIVIVEFHERPIGRLLRYGDLSITVYGSRKIDFKYMPDPLKIKNIIEERKIKHEK